MAEYDVTTSQVSACRLRHAKVCWTKFRLICIAISFNASDTQKNLSPSNHLTLQEIAEADARRPPALMDRILKQNSSVAAAAAAAKKKLVKEGADSGAERSVKSQKAREEPALDAPSKTAGIHSEESSASMNDGKHETGVVTKLRKLQLANEARVKQNSSVAAAAAAAKKKLQEKESSMRKETVESRQTQKDAGTGAPLNTSAMLSGEATSSIQGSKNDTGQMTKVKKLLLFNGVREEGSVAAASENAKSVEKVLLDRPSAQKEADDGHKQELAGIGIFLHERTFVVKHLVDGGPAMLCSQVSGARVVCISAFHMLP